MASEVGSSPFTSLFALCAASAFDAAETVSSASCFAVSEPFFSEISGLDLSAIRLDSDSVLEVLVLAPSEDAMGRRII